MDAFLNSFSDYTSQNLWIAPLIALAAGFIASFTPCCLSNVPIIIGYVSGSAQSDAKRAFKLSLMFVAGTGVTFCALGLIASLAGKFFSGDDSWFHIIMGALLSLMCLQIWGIYEIIPSAVLKPSEKKKGYAGAFLTGIVSGVFATPCSTPVLIVLLAFAARQNSVLIGTLMLLCYSVGHGILSVAAGTSAAFAHRLAHNEKYEKWSDVFKILLGIVVFSMALYMFYLGF